MNYTLRLGLLTHRVAIKDFSFQNEVNSIDIGMLSVQFIDDKGGFKSDPLGRIVQGINLELLYDNENLIIAGIVTGFEYEYFSDILHISFNSTGDFFLNGTERTKIWQEGDYRATIIALCDKSGVKCSITGGHIQVKPDQFIRQQNESDWNFLLRICRYSCLTVIPDIEKQILQISDSIPDGQVFELDSRINHLRFRGEVKPANGVSCWYYDYKKADSFSNIVKADGMPGEPNLDKIADHGINHFKGKEIRYQDFLPTPVVGMQRIESLHKGYISKMLTLSGIIDDHNVRIGDVVSFKGGNAYGQWQIISTLLRFSDHNPITKFQAVKKGFAHHFPSVVKEVNIPGIEIARVYKNEDPENMGRVQLNFYWSEQYNPDMSPWVRTLYPHASPRWGYQNVYEKGMDVFVAYENGDPDMPVVIGNAYNSLRTNVTDGDRSVNEDNFSLGTYDGKNTIFMGLGSEKYINIFTEGKLTISAEEIEVIARDKVMQLRAESDNINLNSSKTISNSAGDDILSKAEKNISTRAGENMSTDVGKNSNISVGENLDSSVGKNSTASIGENYTSSIAKKSDTSVGEDMSINTGKRVTIAGGEDISLAADKQMQITSSKDMLIKSDANFKIDSSKKTDIKAGGDVKMQGKKVAMKGDKIMQN